MNTTISLHQSSSSTDNAQDNISLIDTTALSELLKEELTLQLGSLPSNAITVSTASWQKSHGFVVKSDRIQHGGEIRSHS
jgi:hypothetical protein